jgi:hypothetical protein
MQPLQQADGSFVPAHLHQRYRLVHSSQRALCRACVLCGVRMEQVKGSKSIRFGT